MKILCMAGLPTPEFRSVMDMFFRAGMASPLPTQHTLGPIDIVTWHAKLLSYWNNGQKPREEVFEPGKLWEQLAGNIFLENINVPLWGWGCSDATWLLQFWHRFDSKIFFILVAQSPQRALASMISEWKSDKDIAAALEAWQASHETMLRFYLNHRDRSLLIDASDCLNDPNVLMKVCAEHFGISSLDNTKFNIDNRQPVSPLVSFLMSQLLSEYPQVLHLQRELEASIVYMNGQSSSELSPSAALSDVIIEANGCMARSRKYYDILKQYDTLQGDDNNRRQRLEILEKQTEIRDQDNELLSIQLRQFQRDLEDVISERDNVKFELTTKRKLVEELDKKLAAGRVQIETLRGERDAAILNVKITAEKLNDERQLHDESGKKLIDTNKGLALLQAKIHQVQAERDAAIDREKHAVDELKRIRRMKDEIGEQLVDKKSALKLLQTQMQQAQLDIKWFRRYKNEIEASLSKAKERLRKIVEDNPAAFSYDSIHVKSVVGEQPDDVIVCWCLQEFCCIGHMHSSLSFETILTGGTIGFTFIRDVDGASPLLRWPVSALERNALTLTTNYSADDTASLQKYLTELAASDWLMLRSLCLIVQRTLSSPMDLALPETFPTTIMLAACERLLHDLAVSPVLLRYDHVHLKQNFVNPSYEHLWLQVEGLTFAGRRLPHFEFRIACASLDSESFGTYSKLEFPSEFSHIAFQNAFDESHDDYGPKLEMRFALPEAIDMAIWERLSDQDQWFLRALIEGLRVMLEDLAHSDTQIARPWLDWLGVAGHMQRILPIA